MSSRLCAARSRFPTSAPALDLAALLGAVGAKPLGPLLEAPQLAAARAVADAQPACWRWCMFETRLSGGASQVDFMACIADVEADRELVSTLPPPVAGWGDGEPIIREWAKRRPPLDRVPIIWLEWDLPGDQPRPPLFSLSLDARLLDTGACPPPRNEQCRVVNWLIARTFSTKVADGIQNQFASCLASLPDDARMMHVAPLTARNLDRLRLTLGLLPGELCDWLHRIGWPGDLDKIRSWLPLFAPSWQRVFFQIELGEVVHEHLSVETRVQSTKGGVIPLPLLDRLIAAGLVDVQRADAAQSWPGVVEVDLEGSRVALVRSAYAKLMLCGGVASELKAYLGLSRRAPDR